MSFKSGRRHNSALILAIILSPPGRPGLMSLGGIKSFCYAPSVRCTLQSHQRPQQSLASHQPCSPSVSLPSCLPPCPRCLVIKTRLEGVGTKQDHETRTRNVRVDDLQRQVRVDIARDLIYRNGFGVASTRVNDILKEHSYVPTPVNQLLHMSSGNAF